MISESEKHVEACQCLKCGKAFQGEVKLDTAGGRSRRIWPFECPECAENERQEWERKHREYLKQERPEERKRWRERSGIPVGFITRSFGNFEPGWQDAAVRVCRQYAEGFRIEQPQGYRSLVLYSPGPGVGKTHLMIAVANLIIDRWEGEPGLIEDPIFFQSGPGLVRRVRATYHHDGEERENDIYEELRGVKLLLLDDLGMEKPSDFTRELYWYLVNERVSNNLPVVMTCRLPLEGNNSLVELMGVDTVDRLYGMTRGQIEVLEGPSYRKLNRVV